MVTTVRSIAELVSQHTGVPTQAIYGRGRGRPVVRARFAVCLIARRNGLSFPQIGARLGKDHSTIIYATSCAEEFERREPAYAAMLADVAAGKGKAPERPLYTPIYVTPSKKRKARWPMFEKDTDPNDSGLAFHKGVGAGSLALLEALRAA